jgi:two-component system OmpR family response regulator
MIQVSSRETTAHGSSDRGVRVLLVEDDPALQRMIVNYFGEHNMRTLLASGRKDMVRHLSASEVDLVILELRLGASDGLDLLRELRSESDVPVIIITGHGRDEVDHIVGLELGADDYLTKPFNLRELLARVRAILRRFHAGRATQTTSIDRGGFRFAGWELDRRARRLIDPSGTPVPLTKGEYDLLLGFLGSPERPLSREQLLRATGAQQDVFDRSIDVQILRLRRKLEKVANAPRFIRTERGVGYVFSAPVEPF